MQFFLIQVVGWRVVGLVEWSVDPSVVQMVGGHLVGQLIGWSFGRVFQFLGLSLWILIGWWVVGWLFDRWVHLFLDWLVGRLVVQAVVASVSESFGRLVVGMIGLLVG